MSTVSNTLFSQQTGHKYTFQLQFKKLFINPSLPFEVKVVWARGQNRIQSQNPIRLQPPENQVILQQCFCNKSTVLFNLKKNQFRKKQSKIQIILYANGSPKQGGQYLLNLCEILDPYNIKNTQQKTYRVVTRQQKPRCQIEFKLTAQYCQQMIRDQQRSIGSGVASISSKNTTSMGIGISSDQKNYVQKKNLFLYQAPSKDNQSVVSYTSYNTGIMRYGSNKKQRDDSTSLKKEDYGISGMTKRQSGSNDFFNKTANMKSNISQEYDLKSKNGSYNRYTQPNNNFDNKTQNFDPSVSNKQLIQEQTKRSKLQAEVSRLNIYMKEQSNKLSEYITENTRLKQQLNRINNESQNSNKSIVDSMKQQYQELMDKIKKQNDDLHNRAFQLNNQNRQLHRKLDNLSHDFQRAQEQVRRIRLEKQRAQTRFEALNRNMQGIISTKQHSSKQLQNLKDQIQHIKSLNLNLRQNLEKQRRQKQQIQYSNKYQLTSFQEAHKKKQQRLYDLQRDYQSVSNQLKDKERQIQSKKQILYRLQKTNEQYKVKIVQSQNEKNQIFEDNKSLKNELYRIRQQNMSLSQNMMKMRDEKTAEFEQKNINLQNTNYQYQQKIRSLEFQVQQSKKNYSAVSGINQTFKKDLQDRKNQIYRLEANTKALKQVQNKFYGMDKLYADKQRQLSYAKQQNNKLIYKNNQLEDLCRKLTIQLEQNRKKIKQTSQSDVDVNQILRQSVQLQVELKFKTDQLLRLRGIEQQYQDIRYRYEIQQRNRRQLEQDGQRIERQMKQKNKLYLIEVEKGKLMNKQKIDIEKEHEGMRNQLKRCQQIIFNGDKQVKQMQLHIAYLQGENKKIIQKIPVFEQQINSLRGKTLDLLKFENRIKQLEKQIDEKSYMMNLMTTNLSNSQKKMGELQFELRSKIGEIEEVKRYEKNTSQKIIQLQEGKHVVTNELQRILNQKKAVQLKCEMIMQELHSLKKSFEEQKGRSTSIVSIRSSEEQLKIRQLQNQVQKKDRLISKLTKQKLQIEQENINLHVQVMKKLSEMQKGKDSTSSISSQKYITVTPK